MAEKLDIPMNTFPQATDAKFLYGEDLSGNQLKIESNKLLNIIVDGSFNATFDCNSFNFSSIIRGHIWVNAPISTIAILETIVYSKDWIIQRFSVPGENVRMFVRSFYNGNTWSNWRSVNII